MNTRSQMGKGGPDKDAIYCGVTDSYWRIPVAA